MATSELYREKDLLPTPTSTDSQNGKRKSSQVKPGSKHSVTLKQADGPLPTPTTGDRRSAKSKQQGINNTIGSISSQEASHVSHFHRPGNDEAQKMTAFSGLKCCESLKNSDPLGLLARTLLVSLRWSSRMVRLEWRCKTLYSVSRRTRSEITTQSQEELSATFDNSAIKPFGLLYQLVPSALRTEEIECGLLRTPDTGMTRGPRSTENLKDRYLVRKMPLNLNDQIAMQEKNLLATPQASDGQQGSVIGKGDQFRRLPSGRMRKVNKNGVDGSVGLAREIAMLPTPRSREGNAGSAGSVHNSKKNYLDGTIQESGIKTGLKLQPNFVEWMMGYPQGWTDLS